MQETLLIPLKKRLDFKLFCAINHLSNQKVLKDIVESERK